MRRFVFLSCAYMAAVLGAALFVSVLAEIIFGDVGLGFLATVAVGIFVLALPGSALFLAFRTKVPSRLIATVSAGFLNGVIVAIPATIMAAHIGLLAMLAAGCIGGVVFWMVERWFPLSARSS